MAAAAGTHLGCDFWAFQAPQIATGACFAVQVVNVWDRPVHLTWTRDGSSVAASSSTLVFAGQGASLTHSSYDAVAGLAPGHAATVFLAQQTGGSLGACPVAAALAIDTSVSGTGYGSAFHLATDYPVAAMRGRRVRVMDHWVDIVQGDYPPSAYRVPAEGIRSTFMAVEIALAVITAARRLGLSEKEIHGIFFENGMKLLRGVRGGRAITAVEKAWS